MIYVHTNDKRAIPCVSHFSAAKHFDSATDPRNRARKNRISDSGYEGIGKEEHNRSTSLRRNPTSLNRVPTL